MESILSKLDVIIKILQVGASGFAVVLLILGYLLLNQLLKTDSNIPGFRQKLIAVIIFMGASFFFFIAGMAGQILLHENEYPIGINLMPSQIPDGVEKPVLHHGTKVITIDNGSAEFKIKSGEMLTFEIVNLTYQVENLKQLLNQTGAQKMVDR